MSDHQYHSILFVIIAGGAVLLLLFLLLLIIARGNGRQGRKSASADCRHKVSEEV